MLNRIFNLLETARVPAPKFIRQHRHEYHLAYMNLYLTPEPDNVVYQLLLNSLCPTTIILNTWLKRLSFLNARKLFSIMLKKGLANPGTFASYMRVADKACHYDEVREIFAQAKQLHHATTRVHEHYIACIGKISYEEAEKAFESIQQKRLISIDTYRCFIDIASKHQKTDKLLQIANEILSKGVQEKKLLYTLLNALVRNKLIDQALHVYHKARLPLPTIVEQTIDLHGHTYGSAYIYLTLCLNDTTSFAADSPIYVITGRGLHSTHFDKLTGEHPTYQAVKHFSDDKELVLCHDKRNAGMVHLMKVL